MSGFRGEFHALCLTLVFTGLAGSYVLTVRGQEVLSGNGEYAAKVDETSDRKVVYRVADGEALYSLPNLPGQFFLSEDGQYAAVCEHWLSPEYKKKDVVLQFYRRGRAVAGLELRDLLEYPTSLRREGTRYRWGQCGGFLRDTIFAVDTIESQRITYDPATGQQAQTRGIWPPKPVPSPSPQPSVAVASAEATLSPSVYVGDHNCNGSPLFCDDFVNGYKNGWIQVRGKWGVRNTFQLSREFPEHVLYQPSDQQRERNSLLYYDRQNFSDVDVTTILKMDLTFPQLAIEEDAQRIRRLRRIAGAGIVFRLQDENNYYMFRLAGEEGAVLGKMVDGEWFDLKNPRAVDFLNSPRLHYSDRIYALRVRTQGSRIQCWLTEWVEEAGRSVEQALVSLQDDTFATGRAGVVTFEAQAEFLYFRVDEL